jgi:membrane-bound serine protease (ClpP class)
MNIRFGILLISLLAGLVPVSPLAVPPPPPVPAEKPDIPDTAQAGKVFIIPIRDDIMPPLVYLVRRGVKAAMEERAALLVLDMETNGGRVDTTEEIIEIINQFPGQAVTYVNRKAFSAGAFIAVATQQIYMAPQSVIGAAAPMIMMPGSGPADIPETMEAKMTSGIRALVRANAEKNGHNVEVVEAMIDRNRRLEIDGEVLNEKGQILTLTNVQAEREYGDPPRPLFSAGTFESLDALLADLGYAQAQRVHITPTGVERIGTWIQAISPLLLIIGVIGIYLEFKTPGFGIPGIAGVLAFALYFFGGYVAGLSGMEWIAIFIIGLVLVALELFVFPGILVLGFTGALLMLVSVVMAMVDIYPSTPGLPVSLQFRVPVNQIVFNLSVAMLGSLAAMWLLSLFLPRTNLYSGLVSSTVSGESSVLLRETAATKRMGEVGTAISTLRPGGKAQFGDEILDVITQGEMIPKGAQVRVVGHSSSEAVVEAVSE